jgi:hypothetical protein
VAAEAAVSDAPPRLRLACPNGGWSAKPLQRLTVLGAAGGTFIVRDAQRREYARGGAGGEMSFTVGGALGTHTIDWRDEHGRAVDSIRFEVDAQTRLDDEGGIWRELLDILRRTMYSNQEGYDTSLEWRGRTYRYYVCWLLDHENTSKGLRYFSPHAAGLIDLMREAQRGDGMIWSFAKKDMGPGYFDTAYGADGYALRDGGALFARQPVENHCEYTFVEGLYLAWKGNADDAWMAGNLDAARRALDYSMHDRSRWSSRFGLLKRAYCIDSWDFQAEDAYMVKMELVPRMRIDPDRTRFGVFFGDNTGYAMACDQLAEMLARTGRAQASEEYRKRGREIRRRLDALAWNGRFYTHHVEEDPSVHRDFGVDEKSQVAMANAYSLNRGVTHAQAVAILQTYQDLRERLPAGAPGEWYSIYPPFQRGFEQKDNAKWQYMNAAVHGHAAGELARGAMEHGFEAYGADVLRRILDLGRKYGGLVRFSYRGALEPPPPPAKFTPLDSAPQANMDLADRGGEGVPPWMGVIAGCGNDLRNMPVGMQTLAGAPFRVPDPARNGRRGAIGVSCHGPLPKTVEVPVGRPAAAAYLLHAAHHVGAAQIGGIVTFRYTDGSEEAVYLFKGKQVSGWWFPVVDGPDAGVAWRGPNPKSHDVGVGWCAVVNHRAEKTIGSLQFSAPNDGTVYGVLGVTLADRAPYHEPKMLSTGEGPDCWAGGTCTAALLEGLAGIQDLQAGFREIRLAPRWTSAGTDRVDVTVRYTACRGYVAYAYRHDADRRRIELDVTAGGSPCHFHVLLPPRATRVSSVAVDGKPQAHALSTIENSRYADFQADILQPRQVTIRYDP